jgi:phage terminase large subunit
LATLENLTGVRLQRLRYGKWVSAEGQIYDDYDPAIHLVDSFPIPAHWRRFRCIDFGLIHPFVCGWWAVDEDERLYLYRQIYMTGRTVASHARQIKELTGTEKIEDTICDHDAEDRLTLQENGIPNIPAKKDVLQGIGKVQDRLKKQADDRPRLFIFRGSLVEIDQALKIDRKPYAVEQEFDSYIWATTTKEQPVKEFDHGMDMARYITMHLDGPSRWSTMGTFIKV